jgi:hypothetical protein
MVGSALAIGGLGLFFLGITGGVLWLPIVGALYAIGYLLVPGEPDLDLRLSSYQDAAQVRAGLDRLLGSVQGRIADDLYMRVEHIRDAILLMLPAANAASDASDPDIYLIRQTALSYLPEALASYLAVPRLYAERGALAGGRTPHDVLLEQLDLMDSKMQEVAEDVMKHDSERLLANGRFLAERFAPSALNLPVQPADPAVVTAASQAEADQRERVHG